MNRSERGGVVGLRLIAAYKLAKALLLVAAGCGILGMVPADVRSHLMRWATALGLDANNPYLHSAIARLAGVDRRALQMLGIGTLLYALLNVVEGVGLWLRLRWAECLTVVATALLLPVEAVEIVRRPTAPRFLVVALSLGIILYLIHRLEVDRPNTRQGSRATDERPARFGLFRTTPHDAREPR